jgi:RecA-family ATPase
VAIVEDEPSIIETAWICLRDAPDILSNEPPPQRWLLTRWHDRRDHGVLPRGKTGLVNATGGVGKTYCLIQLALAVSSGGFWLETFRAERGHVLLALAEEDTDEARRRLWRAANALGLSRRERDEIAERIHLLPLAGVSVALTCSPAHGTIVATETAAELRRALESRDVDWALVIIDPLSRWAGGGVEADNEAATRFCQIVETLATVRGNPAILVAHHSSKTSARDGAADARGVTGIRDGFRWQATLDPIESDDGAQGVILRNRKSNYSMTFPDMVLMRNTEPGTEGTLRPASEAEEEAFRDALPRARQTAKQREEARSDAKQARFEAECEAILSCLPTEPAHMSRDELLGALSAVGRGCSHHTLAPRIAKLMQDGRMVDLSDGSRSSPREYALPAERGQ